MVGGGCGRWGGGSPLIKDQLLSFCLTRPSSRKQTNKHSLAGNHKTEMGLSTIDINILSALYIHKLASVVSEVMGLGWFQKISWPNLRFLLLFSEMPS